MFQLYRNKYRIKSARKDGYDYTQDGLYFVTICTKDKYMFFGDIVEGKMVLNKLGNIADKLFFEIPNHFPFVRLDEHIIMPNHVHGILKIDNVMDGNKIMNGGNAHGNANGNETNHNNTSNYGNTDGRDAQFGRLSTEGKRAGITQNGNQGHWA